jgi:hypothetical protein
MRQNTPPPPHRATTASARSSTNPARPTGDGRTVLALSPLEFLAALSRPIPPPRVHRHRYHGVLAPNARLRERVTNLDRHTVVGPRDTDSRPVPTPQAGTAGVSAADLPDSPHSAAARSRWARLLARIYEAFPLTCPDCGGDMRILAFITAAEPAALKEMATATQFAAERQLHWERITAAIYETRNLAATWDAVALEERRVLFDWWVLDVMIAIEPLEGYKRANQKYAIVTLRSAPDAPRYFTFGRDLASPSSNSTRTNGSRSTVSMASRAETASGDPISPSAQAECPRTSGSGSASVATSTGTASSAPQFPSATATLRLNPAYPARRTADPRVHSSHSSYVIRMSDIRDGKDVPGSSRSSRTRSRTRSRSPSRPFGSRSRT